jgi:sugar lactone lactonase YvrE
MGMKKAELVVDVKAQLGEGPCWDEAKQLLYWVDIPNHQVHIYSPDKNSVKTIDTNQYVSAVVPIESGGLLLAMHHGLYTLDLESESFTPFGDPEKNKPGNRFNDGKCDARGRFWAGTMAIDESPNMGALYCLDKDLSIRKVLDGTSISNGLAWDYGNRTMYFIDTPTKKVAAFDYDLESGSLSNKRDCIHFPDGEGFPDGMTIDQEGMLWIAHWDGGQISRWNPATGEKLDSIQVPAPRVTSCVFAGEKLNELYITTARVGMSDEELELYPYAGGLFKVKLEVKGTKTFGFGG